MISLWTFYGKSGSLVSIIIVIILNVSVCGMYFVIPRGVVTPQETSLGIEVRLISSVIFFGLTT